MRRFVQCDENKPVMLDEEETLNHTIPNIDLTFDADEPSTTGTLFITSRRFVWLSEETAYDFDVQYIALHAISNDPASYKKPCLYCQVCKLSIVKATTPVSLSSIIHFCIYNIYHCYVLMYCFFLFCLCNNIIGILFICDVKFDQEGDEDEDEPTEVFFIPADEKEVQTLFDLFSEAALNNPDDDEEEEEGGEEGGGCFREGLFTMSTRFSLGHRLRN